MENTKPAGRTDVNVKSMTQIALMAALICVLGPLTLAIPVSPVPISLQNLAIYIALYAVGMKKGTISYLIYLLIGFVGLPVFSGFSQGPSKLLGPTGGYLIGFIFMALIAGWCIDNSEKVYVQAIGLVVGTAVCYTFGTVWLCYQAHMDAYAGLMAGVIPFIPGDIAKIAISIFLGRVLRRQLKKANLF